MAKASRCPSVTALEKRAKSQSAVLHNGKISQVVLEGQVIETNECFTKNGALERQEREQANTFLSSN